MATFDVALRDNGASAFDVALSSGRAPATFHIAPTGNDTTGDGSIGLPWRTLGKLYSQATVPGDVGYVWGGTYVGADIVMTIVSSSGTASDPITVVAFPGETPIFDGAAGDYPALWFKGATSYHVVDGLQFTNWTVTDSAVLVCGADAAGTTSYITIQRCKFTHKAGQGTTEHLLYLSNYSDHITVGGAEGYGNVFIGNTVNDPGEGSAVQAYHSPGSTNAVVSWNLVVGMSLGIQMFDDDSTGEISHNTVVNCYNQIDTRYGTWTVRDNVSTAVSNLGISDLYSGTHTITQDHNYEGQTLTAAPAYGLTAGSPAIGGSSTATDAGWVAYVPVTSDDVYPFINGGFFS